MASIIPNTKEGKIISYKFKACVGRNDCGKQVFRCTTWKVPSGLGPVKAEKAAEKAAAAWEQEAKAEYEKDLLMQSGRGNGKLLSARPILSTS